MNHLVLIKYYLLFAGLLFVTTIASGQMDSLISLYEQEGDAEKKYGLLVQVCSSEYDGAYMDTLQPYQSMLLKLAQERKDTASLLTALDFMGHFESSYGHDEQAIAYYQQELEMARQAGNKKMTITALRMLARLNMYNFGHAQKFHELILTAIDSLKNFNDPKLSSQIANDLTVYFSDMAANYDKALHWANKGIVEAQKSGSKKYIVTFNCFLAGIYVELGQLDSARVYSEEALKLAKRWDFPYFEALAMCYESQVELGSGNKELALEIAEAAHLYAKEVNYAIPLVTSRVVLAKACMANGKTARARRVLNEYLENSKQRYFASNWFAYRILSTLAELEKGRDPNLAMQYLQEATVLKDTLMRRVYSHELASVETDYHLAEQEAENHRLQLEKKQQEYEAQTLKYIIVAAAGVILFLLLGSLYVYKTAKKNKRLADELGRSNQLLEIKSVELLKANKDLELFSYSLAHDIKGYVNQALNYTFFLDEKPGSLPEEQANNFLVKARRSIKGLHTFCDDLISYARMGQDNSAPAEVNLNGVMEEVRSALALQVEQTGAEIQFPKNFPMVFAHRPRMVQLFQNLIGNAIKYHRPGVPAQVKVDFVKQADEYLFTVSDNGEGIPADRQERLFELFVKGKTGGSGIGLAVCRRIVEQYGGRIWAESEVGKGSRFHFTIPA